LVVFLIFNNPAVYCAMKKIKGIVFDMDGVLIDSEPVHIEAWNDVFAEFNLHFSHEWFNQWIGVSDKNFTSKIIQEFNIATDADKLLQDKRRVFEAKIAQGVPSHKGVKELMPKLHNFDKAVATSSNRSGAMISLEGAGLISYFKKIVTADDVLNHKPNPDCYLKAAHDLGFEPSECIGIEDSVSGIKAAKAAGLFIIGVATSLPAHYLTEADLVLENTEGAMLWILENH
jgi:HAD superfamily hydrolase (TIGR01509 family)